MNFVVTASYERRNRPAPDPEYPGSGVQRDSRVRYPAADIFTLKLKFDTDIHSLCVRAIGRAAPCGLRMVLVIIHPKKWKPMPLLRLCWIRVSHCRGHNAEYPASGNRHAWVLRCNPGVSRVGRDCAAFKNMFNLQCAGLLAPSRSRQRIA